MIFVFGSNLRGIHGAGAALHALKEHGAMSGLGEGHWRNSYALPTCSEPGVPLLLADIKHHVSKFLKFAQEWPELQFQVTAIGCGLAGYVPEEIAPMFLVPHPFVADTVPDNVWLPGSFVAAIYKYGLEAQIR